MENPVPGRRSLVVFLENGGAFGHLNLPPTLSRALDYWSERGARTMLSMLGADRHWQEIRVLEDQRAHPDELLSTLVGISQRAVADLLVLTHGSPEGALGWQGACLDQGFLDELQAVRVGHGLPLHLGCVYTIACHSAHQADAWLAVGAQAVNGVLGENWLPVPTLPLFLARWQKGATFGEAALAAHLRALYWARGLAGRDTTWLARIEASRQMVAGRQDVRLAEGRSQVGV
ncbi:MAG: hypothetical protein F4Y08_06310 [Caldilineaceae bacterium SB0662_bin_9]|uniref:CHAT domain-containing protein n=1 Tax=Caldilineaceae bacterium SB0662_bin_9 TaxID=2605258 RepID=A0A6B1DQE2_9CHLR|nr:hypothetical protein [Caldilineaceae bacterium SB0662_bin_9]